MWVYEDIPKLPGWYATNHSWDTSEGSFIYATFFDGKKWIPDRPICAFAGPFQTEEQAEEFGEENDISW